MMDTLSIATLSIPLNVFLSSLFFFGELEPLLLNEILLRIKLLRMPTESFDFIF